MAEAFLIAALAGGVGAARFLTGLRELVRDEDLSVIVNTGDDFELFGLHISPDVDIITYTLGGIVDEEKGWGIKGDTFHCLEMLGKQGLDTWFSLGDKDFAIHIYRTMRLKQGYPLSQITDEIRRRLDLEVKILVMTNEKFETNIRTNEGLMHFEEYFVRKQCKDEILGVEFIGTATAKPAPGVLNAIMDSETIVVCPSNPIVSIKTILSVNGIRDALRSTSAKIVGISPIVSGSPVKGPADKLMRSLGLEVSAFGVASFYSDFLDVFVLDSADFSQKERIEKLGIEVEVAETLMSSFERKVELARIVLGK